MDCPLIPKGIISCAGSLSLSAQAFRMTELDYLFNLHLGGQRQGPGSPESTRKALSFIGLDLQSKLQIADIGCGTGAQTFALAHETQASIVAVDFSETFLAELNRRAKGLGYKDRIHTLQSAMEELPFESDQFDIIWAEGSIYNMGFQKGVNSWKPFLKPGGYLAVSELSWLQPKRPAAIENYWNQHYPDIQLPSGKIKTLEEEGFQLCGYFPLPPTDWMDHYYLPIEERMPTFLERHNHHETVRQIAAREADEFAHYQKYQDYYSYGFYVAQKV